MPPIVGVHRHRIQPTTMPVVPGENSTDHGLLIRRHKEQPVIDRQLLIDRQGRQVVRRVITKRRPATMSTTCARCRRSRYDADGVARRQRLSPSPACARCHGRHRAPCESPVWYRTARRVSEDGTFNTVTPASRARSSISIISNRPMPCPCSAGLTNTERTTLASRAAVATITSILNRHQHRPAPEQGQAPHRV